MYIVPGTIWISGITASGKSTLGEILTQKLAEAGINNLEFLDGDKLRTRLDRVYGHSLEERFKVLNKIIQIARQFNEYGKIVIVATVSHKKIMRATARKEIERFMEVNLKCPVEVCIERDYKGIYDKANSLGEYVAGITEPYEMSDNPELILDTANLDIDECSCILFRHSLNFVTSNPL